jgi:hypothetical protein
MSLLSVDRLRFVSLSVGAFSILCVAGGLTLSGILGNHEMFVVFLFFVYIIHVLALKYIDHRYR